MEKNVSKKTDTVIDRREFFSIVKVFSQHELLNLLKAFIYDTHVQETQKTETFTDIYNPAITKHKE